MKTHFNLYDINIKLYIPTHNMNFLTSYKQICKEEEI